MSSPLVDEFGHQRWKDADGQLHRDGDLPAIEWANGDKEWYVRGQRHRDGGLPAIEWANGDKQWYVRGQLHRDGGLPAAECANGTKSWYVRGQRHRDGGLPAIERAGGRKEWWVRDQRHRDGGLPAIERADGDKSWWFWYTQITEAHAQRTHRLLVNRARRQRGRTKTRRFLALVRSRAFVEWFYAPDQMGGRWAKHDLARFARGL